MCGANDRRLNKSCEHSNHFFYFLSVSLFSSHLPLLFAHSHIVSCDRWNEIRRVFYVDVVIHSLSLSLCIKHVWNKSPTDCRMCNFDVNMQFCLYVDQPHATNRENQNSWCVADQAIYRKSYLTQNSVFALDESALKMCILPKLTTVVSVGIVACIFASKVFAHIWRLYEFDRRIYLYIYIQNSFVEHFCFLAFVYKWFVICNVQCCERVVLPICNSSSSNGFSPRLKHFH